MPLDSQLAEELADPDRDPRDRARRIDRLAPELLLAFDRDWSQWALDSQRAPPGDWRVWLLLAGRGYGKTRAGAEWVSRLARRAGDMRIALVGATIDDVRMTMIEGESGLLAVAEPDTRPRWEPSKGELSWRSGARAFVFSAEKPDGLRGPAHDYAWCDELAKWNRAEETWDNLMMGLRRGKMPRALVTTTPRPVPLVRRLIDDASVHKSFGRTHENGMLPAAFVEAMIAHYGGTRLGRQELDGELIADAEGALWRRATIEACRAAAPSDPVRVVIGVDPPAGIGGDACGIVAVALGHDDRGYVIEDASVAGQSPERWACAVAACAMRHGADRVVAEANNGGEMVRSVLKAADAALPLTLVHASRGKSARAEPVAALYERGRVAHAGTFPALEDELCGLLAGGGYEGPGRSPDRADALVWALTALMLGPRREARVRAL